MRRCFAADDRLLLCDDGLIREPSNKLVDVTLSARCASREAEIFGASVRIAPKLQGESLHHESLTGREGIAVGVEVAVGGTPTQAVVSVTPR